MCCIKCPRILDNFGGVRGVKCGLEHIEIAKGLNN